MSTCVVGNDTARLEAETAYRGGALANMPTRGVHRYAHRVSLAGSFARGITLGGRNRGADVAR